MKVRVDGDLLVLIGNRRSNLLKRVVGVKYVENRESSTN